MPHGADEMMVDGADTRGMARSIGALYASGSVVVLLWAMLHRGSARPLMAGMALLALGLGLALLSGAGDRLTTRWFHLGVIAAVQVLITVAFVAVQDPTNDVRLFYIWATPFACFFFRPKHAAWHLAWVGLLLAIGLAMQPTTLRDGARVWVITYGTLLVVGLLVLSAAAGVRRREAALRRAASFDPLTGLANRALFARRAAEALDGRRERGGDVILVLADLDRFKVVNDTHGHLAGDHLLQSVALVLEQAAPPGSLVARMGGDEFAVLIDDQCGPIDTALAIADVSAALCRVVDIGRARVHTSASIGVVVADVDDTPTSMLRDADVAMYRAKRTAAGSMAMRDDRQREESARSYQIEEALHDAIELGQLRLVYQPVIDLSSGRMVGAETLLRWRHPDFGEVSPAEFIPLAEQTGTIRGIGSWVIEEAVAQLSRWQRAGALPDDFRLSINVSGHQLTSELPDLVARLLARYSVAPQRLMLELTETVIISALTEATGTLRELRSMGLHLVLDDFGTGFSSLSHLQRARFDAVKIDRSFVRGAVDTGTDRSIISAVLALGEALGFGVVVEGVETVEQSEALRLLGARFAQGFLFDRPLPPSELVARLVPARAM